MRQKAKTPGLAVRGLSLGDVEGLLGALRALGSLLRGGGLLDGGLLDDLAHVQHLLDTVG